MEDNTFTIVNNEGAEVECEILFTFEDTATSKNYIVYTDNTEDDEGNAKVYASIYEPEVENPTLLPLESDEEWERIELLLDEFQKE